ncbi:MAG: hypothetical protein VX589_02045 [Myxococcota bacterium]|nr:hypothetical protein [Myxococcota bacterium]
MHSTPEAPPGPTQVQAKASSLTLAPTITVTGLQGVFDVLRITALSFTAELFLIPADVEQPDAGDAVSLRIDVDQDADSVAVSGDPIRLGAEGRYSVLLRITPAVTGGVSVDVVGEIRTPIVPIERMEPAPTAAEPAPTAAREKDCEPAPTAAAEADMDASEAAEVEEGECIEEPAPTAANDLDEDGEEMYEPAPTAASETDEAREVVEPAPTAAEPAPTAARDKVNQGILSGIDLDRALELGDRVSVSTDTSYEFVAGQIWARRNQTELLVTWDVRGWLRVMFAETLGVPDELSISPAFNPLLGVGEQRSDFSVRTR